jgi:hypothetical protein
MRSLLLFLLLDAVHGAPALHLAEAEVISLASFKEQLVIAYEVRADEWNEQTNVCYWTETYSASDLADKPSVWSLPQCVSLAAGNFTIVALAGDTLRIQAAVVLHEASTNTSTVLSAVASLDYSRPAQPLLQLETTSETEADVSVEITYSVTTYNIGDWNDMMAVCYWVDAYLYPTPGLQSRSTARCLVGHAGTFTVLAPKIGFLQIGAAIVNRGAAVINASTLLSEIASLTLQSSYNGDMPLCRGSEHINGFWKPNHTSTKSFICCDSKDDDHAARAGYCGHVKQLQLFNFTNTDGNHSGAPLFMHSGERSCTCENNQERWSVSKRESHIWTPHTCRLIEWDAHSFCKHLGTRDMVFIGDSTMYQTVATVTNMLVAANATCIQQISYALSDTLVGREFGVYNRGRSMSDIVQQLRNKNNSVIVISAGAHIFEGFESVMAEVAQIIQQIRSSASGLTFAWRTQQPGHRLCGLATAPSHYLQEVSDTCIHTLIKGALSSKLTLLSASGRSLFTSIHTQGESVYNYAKFPEYDYSASAVFANDLQQPVLHLEPLYYRADAHSGNGDCLHYCLPGPLDVAAILLHHMLVIGEL